VLSSDPLAPSRLLRRPSAPPVNFFQVFEKTFFIEGVLQQARTFSPQQAQLPCMKRRFTVLLRAFNLSSGSSKAVGHRSGQPCGPVPSRLFAHVRFSQLRNREAAWTQYLGRDFEELTTRFSQLRSDPKTDHGYFGPSTEPLYHGSNMLRGEACGIASMAPAPGQMVPVYPFKSEAAGTRVLY